MVFLVLNGSTKIGEILDMSTSGLNFVVKDVMVFIIKKYCGINVK